MNLHDITMKYGSLVVFMRLDPAEMRRLVGQTPLAVFAWVGPVFSVFLWVFPGRFRFPEKKVSRVRKPCTNPAV